MVSSHSSQERFSSPLEARKSRSFLGSDAHYRLLSRCSRRDRYLANMKFLDDPVIVRVTYNGGMSWLSISVSKTAVCRSLLTNKTPSDYRLVRFGSVNDEIDLNSTVSSQGLLHGAELEARLIARGRAFLHIFVVHPCDFPDDFHAGEPQFAEIDEPLDSLIENLGLEKPQWALCHKPTRRMLSMRTSAKDSLEFAGASVHLVRLRSL